MLSAQRRRIVFALTVLGAGLSLPAAGADTAGEFAVKGVGRLTCQRFTEARSAGSENYSRFVGWIEGYLTAANRYQPQTHDIAPWESSDLLAFIIENHCQQNPAEPFFTVVQQITAKLQDWRLQAKSPQVEARAGQQTVVIYQEVLRRAQAELARRGIYGSTVDGRYDPKTREAFETFQVLEGLDVTGVPDQKTLSRLFAGQHPLIR